MTDTNETAQNTYDYFAFGKVYGTPTENVTNPYRYTGRVWDPEIDQHYYRYRMYDQDVGRFPARDPIGWLGGVHLYGYVLDNPLLARDPMGQIDMRKECPTAWDSRAVLPTPTTDLRPVVKEAVIDGAEKAVKATAVGMATGVVGAASPAVGKVVEGIQKAEELHDRAKDISDNERKKKGEEPAPDPWWKKVLPWNWF